MAEFITIEPIPETKKDSLQKVWDAVKNVFSEREAVGYCDYPLFLRVNNQLKSPDILIGDRHLGLIIIKVLDINIEEVISFNKDNLELKNFDYNPLQIVQKFSQVFREYCDKETSLKNKITVRNLLIFSNINTEQWQQKGLIGLEDGLNLIFHNQLTKVALQERIERASPDFVGIGMNNDENWQAFLTVISGSYILKKKDYQVTDNNLKNRANILAKAQDKFYNWDAQQEWIGKSIPPGFQRIRGIAGSGKTVLFCQKAALMHLKHPDWQIALVFFSRSLYDQIIELVSKWIEHFSNGEIKYNPEFSNLKVFHAWGGEKREGLYSYLCKKHNQKPGNIKDTKRKRPNHGLADLCKKFLANTNIKPFFDAILIDEGQDLVTDSELKYEDKQAIYWLAYQSLKSIDANSNLPQKRLIWAFDEAQNLSNSIIPETQEIFGENFNQILGGESGGIYPGGARKAYDMCCCYRTPGEILNIAYGIGMGLLRPEGFIKQDRMRKTDLESIGFEVDGDFRTVNTPITIRRPKNYSPNPIPDLWQEKTLNFNIYNSRQEELTALVTKINENLIKHNLKPKDMLIIALGNIIPPDSAKELQIKIANFLLENGLNIYIPTALKPNEIFPKYPQQNADLFWDKTERGITISTIERAKGNEANLVYIIGLDNIAKNEANFSLRNQLFVALTRAKAWVELSGIGAYPFYDELHQVINSGDSFTFTIKK